MPHPLSAFNWICSGFLQLTLGKACCTNAIWCHLITFDAIWCYLFILGSPRCLLLNGEAHTCGITDGAELLCWGSPIDETLAVSWRENFWMNRLWNCQVDRAEWTSTKAMVRHVSKTVTSILLKESGRVETDLPSSSSSFHKPSILDEQFSGKAEHCRLKPFAWYAIYFYFSDIAILQI